MNDQTWQAYAQMPIDDIFKEFDSSLQGLSHADVVRKQKIFGLNQIKESEHTFISILVQQFKSPFFLILGSIGVISLTLGEWYNGIVILLCIGVNVIVGIYQEYKAESILKTLKQYLILKDRVIRDGKEQVVSSADLVPGDIVLLLPGDRIPADMRLVRAENVIVDESVLTGESIVVNKSSDPLPMQPADVTQAANLLFSGTMMASGKAIGIVYATGAHTIMGDLVYLTVSQMRESSFAKKIAKLGKVILVVILLMLSFVVAAHLFFRPDHLSLIDLFIFASALAITVIPEALPVVVTFCLAQGVSRLAAKKVLVKRLSAIEDLGSIQVVCTDKTGTLTENNLEIAQIHPTNSHDVAWFALLAAESSYEVLGNLQKGFDAVLFAQATDQQKKELTNMQRIAEVPFDPQRKRNLILVKQPDGKHLLIVRGMVHAVIALCKKTEQPVIDALNAWTESQERLGHRVIAIAFKEIDSTVVDPKNALEYEYDLNLAGALSFVDPIKKTAFQAIRKARKLGIGIKVLSGDSKEVVGAVCKEIQLIGKPDAVLSGSEFDKQSAEQKQHSAFEYQAFARILPEQKYEIIQSLQTQYEVGYMGDGINDVPALKQSDVSIAVEDAVDSAREVSDVIILQKSLLTLVNGIEEGRIVFANTAKYIKTMLSSNFGNVYALSFITLFIDYLPMLPLQLLLVNLLSDFPMIAISTDEVDDALVRKPSRYAASEFVIPAILFGVVSSLFDLLFFAVFRKQMPATVQTGWFTLSILTELVFIFSIRTERPFYKARRPSAVLISLAVIAGLFAIFLPYMHWSQKIFKFVPLSFHHMMLIFAIVITYFVVTESVKNVYYRNTNHTI